jgi:putative phosphoribosyl transferase
MTRFVDRADAGRQLARALRGRVPENAVVVALPRGGVPVAAEIARALNLELDVLPVRKLGAPDQPELALGAIAVGGGRVLNHDLIRALQITPAVLERLERLERQQLEYRERRYAPDGRSRTWSNRAVILVDDGLATGATMRAAIASARTMNASNVMVAVPVGARDSLEGLRLEADEVICVVVPARFGSVGSWYQRFEQVSDETVMRLLNVAH